MNCQWWPFGVYTGARTRNLELEPSFFFITAHITCHRQQSSEGCLQLLANWLNSLSLPRLQTLSLTSPLLPCISPGELWQDVVRCMWGRDFFALKGRADPIFFPWQTMVLSPASVWLRQNWALHFMPHSDLDCSIVSTSFINCNSPLYCKL